MQISEKQWFVAGIGSVVVVLAVAGFWYSRAKAPVSQVSEQEFPTGESSTTPSSSQLELKASVSPTPVPSVSKFKINAADTIASWSFKGVYTGNDALIKQTNADAAHLTSLLGTGAYDDYDLYIGLGNDSDLVGDGAAAYKNYNRASSIYPSKGLAYASLAHLMDELGAYHTAADAYAKAVRVEPATLEYHLERLNYITRQFPEDAVRINVALADASKQFGDNASILAIEAQWLTGVKRYADAIKAWEMAKMLSPGKDTSSIDTEIARLKAKQ